MRFSVLVFSLILSIYANAQVFQLNESATAIGDDCYRLTKAQNWELGSIWHIEPINLNEYFEITFELNFGCKDADGADGIVFGFQNISTSIGIDGGGIGFEGINPSVGIEFDTFQNLDYNDPDFDHIALHRNGQINPAVSLAGPLPISIASNNVEDCSFHQGRVIWEPNTQSLSVFFDCEERISHNMDIVNEVFGGDPEVFWGFTGATGGLNNEQTVCIAFFTDALSGTLVSNQSGYPCEDTFP